MIDTHCHLNFGAFENIVDRAVNEAKKAGVSHIVIPGTDYATSRKAVEIAQNNRHSGKLGTSASRILKGSWTSQDDVQIYAAVGIHPHHVYELNVKRETLNVKKELRKIEELLEEKSVVAVGEVGMDRHYYRSTKYKDYKIDDNFIILQKQVLLAQIKLAIEYDKSLILHNREAKNDLLPLVIEAWDAKLEGRTVFHCCEPDSELLAFAKEHKMYIGVDGDVTYWEQKQGFIKKVPLEMVVLETDSPFLLPEPYRSKLDEKGKRPINEPKNLRLIAEYIANLHNTSITRIIEVTTANAKNLFGLL